MKHVLTFLLFFPLAIFGQNEGNSHFFKLIVLNENNEILLINFDGSWEIPGARYSSNNTIPNFVDKMADDHGITIEKTNLEALVTFHHQVRDFPTMMFYYRAQYVSGNLVTPSWGEDVKWFSFEKAYALIPYEEMNYIIKSIFAEKEFITGALEVEYDQNNKRTGKFKIIEELAIPFRFDPITLD